MTRRPAPKAPRNGGTGVHGAESATFGPPLVQPTHPSTSPTGARPRQGGSGGGGATHPSGGGLPVETGEVVNDPIDSRFLTDVPFGTTSFWIQPWRAYLDTWPASRLLEAVGINFNVNAQQADATAQLLHDDGFKLARMAIDWPALSYEDPTKFMPGNLALITARLTALHNHGLRPLIVLDAYSDDPTPEKRVTLETTVPAPAGAQTVQLTPASAALVVPGKTGFNGLTFEGAADVLITSVSPTDVATLSRPLLKPLEAGPHPGTTLLYAPFATPKLPDGEANPVFQATLAGWLNYVAQVCKLAGDIVGPGGFDLEVWNELTFSSQFLNAENYYSTTSISASAQTAASAAQTIAASAARTTAAGADATSAAGEAVASGAAPAGAGSPGSRPSPSGSYAGAGSNAGVVTSPSDDPEVEYSSRESDESDYSEEAEAQIQNGEGPESATTEAEGEKASADSEEEAAEDTESPGEAPPSPATSVTRARLATTRASTGKSHKRVVSGEIRKALLAATVAFVRDPANGISPDVGITDGFASETPFPSGAAAPLGLTALSKHPYVGAIKFPAEYHEYHVRPRNALGERDTSSQASFKPLFIPTYQSLFPEYTLTATSTETLTRDLAPFTTYVYGFPHGREQGPSGGTPVQKWITEYNLGIGHKAGVVGPDEVTPLSGGAAELSPADKTHFHAKALLRSLVAMVGKGMSREYFFGAAPGGLSLIGEEFFSALEAHPETYPGDNRGGEIMRGFANMLARFQGPGPEGAPRQLKLVSIAQEGNHAQFSGDGSDAHPDLYDRDVLAVLPFQPSPTRFVIPVYVMTRDLLTLYEPGAPTGDVDRFDLPNETFKITLGNLPETSAPPSVSAYDPLRDEVTPARLVSRTGSTAIFEIAATDYPRLLTLQYSG